MLNQMRILLGFDEPFFESQRLLYEQYLKRQAKHNTSFNLGEEAIFAELEAPYDFDEEKYLFLHEVTIKNVRNRFSVFMNKLGNLQNHSTLFERLTNKRIKQKYYFAHHECEVAFYTLSGAIKKSSTAISSLIEDLRAFKDDITMKPERIDWLEKEENFLINLIPDRSLFVYYKTKQKTRPEPLLSWSRFVEQYNQSRLIPQKFALLKFYLESQSMKSQRSRKRMQPRQDRRIIDAIIQLAQYDYTPAQILLSEHYIQHKIQKNYHSLISKRLASIPEFSNLFVNWVSFSARRGHQGAKRIVDSLRNYLKCIDESEKETNKFYQINMLNEKIQNRLSGGYVFMHETIDKSNRFNTSIIEKVSEEKPSSMFDFTNIARKVAFSLVGMRKESDPLKISIDFEDVY